MTSGLGAVVLPGGRTLFRVWAPLVETLEVEITQPESRTYPLVRDARGYHEALIEGIEAGARYYLRFPDGQRLPDPAARYQPEGVHGPSEIVSPYFDWTDDQWQALDFPDFVIYELHVGAFTRAGSMEVLCLRDDDVIVLVRRPHAPASVALVLSFAPHARTVATRLPE